MLFLIEYDRSQGLLITLKSFDEASRNKADEARLTLELSLSRRELEREVVLLEAASEEDLRRTHRRYFENLSELTEPQRRSSAPTGARRPARVHEEPAE